MTMKKLSLFLAAVIMTSMLAGCGGTESAGTSAGEPSPAVTSESSTPEISEPETAQAAETTEAMTESEAPVQPESTSEAPFRTVNGTHNIYYENVAASDGADTFYVKKHEIWKLVPDGEDELILGKGDAIASRRCLTGGDGMLFYAFYADGDDSVHCYETQTGVETSLGIKGTGVIFYHEGWLYYRDESGICRIRPNGEEMQTIIATDGRFWCLYNDWLYVAHNDGTTVRIHTDGSGEETVKEKSAGGSLPYIVYNGELVYNKHEHEYNTDGEYLYCWVHGSGDENWFYRCTDPGHPESGTLLAGIHEALPEGEQVSYVNVAGDYLYFSDDSNWYVMRKDGTFVKELGMLD